MQDDERNTILERLRAAGPALEGELSGVSDAQATFRPAGKWSILDCVEHIAATEAGMFHLITEGSSPAETADQGREEAFLRNSTNRERKFTAPEGISPRARFASVDLALRTFQRRRSRTIGHIETVDGGDLRNRKTQHPVAGEITCRECLSLIIGHPMRHLEQIREIKQHPDFPRA